MPNPFALLRPRARLLFAALLLAGCAQPNVAVAPVEVQPEPQPQPAATVPPQLVTPVPKPSPSPQRPLLQTPSDIARVALIVPLTGPGAAIGQDLVDAAQMALFDFVVPDIELRVYDSGGNAQVARDAAVKARADGTRLVLGPLFAEAVIGVSGVTRPAGIPVFAFSNDRRVAGNGIYVAGFSPEEHIDRVVAYAAKRGLGLFAALMPDDGFGGRMASILSEVVARRGGRVTETAFYKGGVDATTETVRALARYNDRVRALEEEKRLVAEQHDPFSRRALERLEARDTLGEVSFEALMLPVGGDEVMQIAPLLAFFDVDPMRVKLLGTWVWDDPSLGNEPAMLGAWFAAPPPAARTLFVERFAEVYGRTPDRLSTLAYDAVALAAVLALRDTADPYARVRLENPDGFAGVDGIFRLDETGAVERGLAVLEVQRGASREIDPAPKSFVVPATR